MRSESSVRYSIVVPFFNEQENIPPLYMKITEVMDSIGESYELQWCSSRACKHGA